MVCLLSLHSVGVVTIFIHFCSYSMPFHVFSLCGVILYPSCIFLFLFLSAVCFVVCILVLSSLVISILHIKLV